ncbi:2-amino-4-hydroxy-6-hydroxymethyldihydropteridine pyrophosphokinase [Campylobacterota bacterium]|nr:2-amino-4-hydroxy-6-hydroxymethyldihydropteridine pyrophosphokinase [Campylobacterota bacterium]
MIKTLNSDMTIVYTPNFPSNVLVSAKRFFALIGIGANLGNKKRIFDKLYRFLLDDRAIDPVRTSPLLINPDFSDPVRPIYLNGVIAVRTWLSPIALLHRLNAIEARFGRARSYKNAPRTLDLDIIFYETKTIYNDRLVIPHQNWFERASVVVPMRLLGGQR